jgi:hypothetical protein
MSLSIYYCLSAFSDTTWHESNHHLPLNQSSIDTILALLITIQVHDVETEPPLVVLECDEHGVENFFLADMMCVKCEEELLKEQWGNGGDAHRK